MSDFTAEMAAKVTNEALAPHERVFVQNLERPKLPIFVVGAPRSGTTLLVQLLINRFRLGYINNIHARFWLAPALAAHALGPTMCSPDSPVEYSSNLGGTNGPIGPHEFGWFWRRWFEYKISHEIAEETWGDIDTPFLCQELAGIENALCLPVIYKNPAALTLQISFLARALPDALFICCERDPIYVGQSLLKSRACSKNGVDSWFSVRPPEYAALKDLPASSQVAGQVFFTVQRMRQQLAQVSPMRVMNLTYEGLCGDPVAALAAIDTFIRRAYPKLCQRDSGPVRLSNGNRVKVGAEELRSIEHAYKRFSSLGVV